MNIILSTEGGPLKTTMGYNVLFCTVYILKTFVHDLPLVLQVDFTECRCFLRLILCGSNGHAFVETKTF